MRKTPITDKEAAILFQEYKKNKTNKDTDLLNVISENEDYFDDMTFNKDSIVHDFIVYKIDDDELADDYYIDLISQKWRFYVKKLRDKDMMGITYNNERKIIINEPYANDQITILHEMIHAHETIINQMFPFYHDILFVSLYNKLLKEVPNLYDRIVEHAHTIKGMQITFLGGSHDVLFFLKSLDLDLRLGYKLGTVCGYGRENFDD